MQEDLFYGSTGDVCWINLDHLLPTCLGINPQQIWRKPTQEPCARTRMGCSPGADGTWGAAHHWRKGCFGSKECTQILNKYPISIVDHHDHPQICCQNTWIWTIYIYIKTVYVLDIRNLPDRLQMGSFQWLYYIGSLAPFAIWYLFTGWVWPNPPAKWNGCIRGQAAPYPSTQPISGCSDMLWWLGPRGLHGNKLRAVYFVRLPASAISHPQMKPEGPSS